MAVKSKTQLQTDIAASTFSAGEQVILDDIVDSYEDIFPSVTTAQRNALTPSTGDIVYNTDNNRYEYWNGAQWIAQNSLNTTFEVKVSVSNAELLAIGTTQKVLVSAIGSGYAIIPRAVAYRMAYATAVFDFGADGLGIFSNDKKGTVANQFGAIEQTSINANANRSGNVIMQTAAGGNAISDNQDLVLFAQANATQGGGTLELYITYSIVAY